VSVLASFRRALRVTGPCENQTEFRCRKGSGARSNNCKAEFFLFFSFFLVRTHLKSLVVVSHVLPHQGQKPITMSSCLHDSPQVRATGC
jgi:hypothetical protein